MELSIYLAKVSICTMVFYLLYHFLFSNYTFFKYNRWYLLSTLVLSFVIPATTLQVEKKLTVPIVTVGKAGVNVIHNNISLLTDPEASDPGSPNSYLPLKNLLLVVYVCGVAFLFFKLTGGFFYLLATGRKFTRLDGIRYISVSPTSRLRNSSFFNYVFIDESLNDGDRSKVINHELVHVGRLHFLDKILGNLSVCVLWFNPFAYAFLDAMDANHDFEADELSSAEHQKGDYARLILNLAQSETYSLTNQFSKLPLKKRISMLFKKPTNKMKKLMYFTTLPIIAVCSMAFVNQKEVLISTNVTDSVQVQSAQKTTAYRNSGSGSAVGSFKEDIYEISNLWYVQSGNKNNPAGLRVLVIDAGHGGKDDASKSITGIPEKDMNLKAALILKEEAAKRGIIVMLTRSGDEFLSLSDRVAKQKGSNAFISLHHNTLSSTANTIQSADLSGLEVYFSESSKADRSKDLGASVLKSLKNLTGLPVKNSLINKDLYVLKEATVPSIVVELGNISNQADFNYLSSEANLRKICNLILDGYENMGGC
ncbi:hypothetical protein GS399_19400 [Pedobacter sp. HMF7647]|uniref:N-acetylmuramoyl-L-alanine amidase n=1 Tax=Hufsiella arboris TaxID=2695275 RepID=A0A7K1YG46_9SPHI|nr:N-acetylmuramoyl-L-alanine amidase [Hufsiella arboris]MXV53138.1 hypothetical protein [Hufsiella arboris]